MIIASEEKKSQGPLIVFIDLLFLLVAFFTLLMFFIQNRQEFSQRALESVQRSLSRVTGEEVDLPRALAQLETVVEKYVADQRRETERQRLLAERQKRRRTRSTFRLEYTVDRSGRVGYEDRHYTPQQFMSEVVQPLRAKHWVAFRALAHPDTPFGRVVAIRRILLKDSNEFDTYWDNLTPNRGPAGLPRP